MTILKIKDRTASRVQAAVGAGPAFQKTLASPVTLEGTGLHGGGKVRVVIHPAPEDTGIVFYDGGCEVPGVVFNVIDTSRGTTIGINGCRVRTIEHLMSALRGTGVDNAVVEVFGSETPALDGSAWPYVEAIDAVGLVVQESARKTISIDQPVCVQTNGSFILAVPAQELRITYVMSYDHPLIGSQTATYRLKEADFGTEIAPARTFVLYEEVAGLFESQLARGGSLDNVIVVWQDRMSSDLRFPDELVRHKLVDLVGDLALIGGLLHAEVLAVKSGHTLNIKFASEVLKRYGGSEANA